MTASHVGYSLDGSSEGGVLCYVYTMLASVGERWLSHNVRISTYKRGMQNQFVICICRACK